MRRDDDRFSAFFVYVATYNSSIFEKYIEFIARLESGEINRWKQILSGDFQKKKQAKIDRLYPFIII